MERLLKAGSRRFKWDQHGALKCAWEVHHGYEWSESINPIDVTDSGVLLHEKCFSILDGNFKIQPCRAFDSGKSRAPFLSEPLPGSSARKPDLYNPLDKHLHRQFARIKDPDGCLDFAREYGLLGVGVLGRDDNGEERYYEPHNLWLSEASTFRFLLALSDLDWERDHREFVRKLRETCQQEFRAQEMFGYAGKSSLSLAVAIALASGGSGSLTQAQALELRKRSRKALYRLANGMLSSRVDFQVLPSDLRYVLVVRHLLASMTISLVQHIVGNLPSPKMCKQCDQPIYGRVRSDKLYCCGACRTAHSREEKRIEEQSRSKN